MFAYLEEQAHLLHIAFMGKQLLKAVKDLWGHIFQIAQAQRPVQQQPARIYHLKSFPRVACGTPCMETVLLERTPRMDDSFKQGTEGGHLLVDGHWKGQIKVEAMV